MIVVSILFNGDFFFFITLTPSINLPINGQKRVKYSCQQNFPLPYLPIAWMYVSLATLGTITTRSRNETIFCELQTNF